MSSMLRLNCLVLKPDATAKNIFSIDIPDTEIVDTLRGAIKEENQNTFPYVDADALRLWSVSIPVDDLFEENIGNLNLDGIPLLLPVEELSEVFSDVARKHLHVVVRGPVGIKRPADEDNHQSKYRKMDSDYLIPERPIKRQELITYLYEKVKECPVVMIRGIPGSGKTSTLAMLKKHVEDVEKDVETFFINGWNRNPEDYDEWWKGRLARKLGLDDFGDLFDGEQKKWIFFDDAQLSYGEQSLWLTFFKEIHKCPQFRLVFTSAYGSADPKLSFDFPSESTPMLLDATLSLYPMLSVNYGLAFSREETDMYIQQEMLANFPPLHVDKRLYDLIFTWTCGHIGAIIALVSTMKDYWRDNKYYNELNDAVLTFDSLESIIVNPPQIVPKIVCQVDSAFRRSLPTNDDLQANPDLVVLFHALLVAMDFKELWEVEKRHRSAAQTAYWNGWLQYFVNGELTFPSPLHRFIISSLIVPSQRHVPFASLLDFVKAVVANMRPSLLSIPPRPRRATRGVTFCESRWQAEFYRCSVALTEHSIFLSPENITPAQTAKRGRMDFIIAGPDTNWGVELLWDGRDLEEHNSRFKDGGAYKWWIDNKIISDFVVLDFRCKEVKTSHKDFPNLYHIVFEDEQYRYYQILDCDCNEVTERLALTEE